MKIKEACKATGLTEKAVRYYVENGLVTPDEYTMRGRVYREYSEDDVRLLKSVSTLRRIGMSVESIKKIENGGASEVMQGYIKDLGTELERKQRLLASLSEQDYSRISGAGALAELVEVSMRAEPAPPDFSQLNDPELPDSALSGFEARSYEREQQLRRGARLGFIVTAAVLFGSALALTSLLGIGLFILAAVTAIGLGSDYVGFYRSVCVLGVVADGVAFIRSFGELENKDLLSQLFSNGHMEPAAMPCLFYLLAVIALAASFALLMTNKALIDYLRK